MQFTKMHGLGNDYLYVYGEPEHPAEWSVKLSNRHFGAGSDGMIWICPLRSQTLKCVFLMPTAARRKCAAMAFDA